MRILILEDNPSDQLLIVDALPGHTHEVASNRVSFQTALGQEWDVIVSDYSLPSFTALDALNMIHRRGIAIPLVVVTGTLGDEAAAYIMRLGAAGYVLKRRLATLAAEVARVGEIAMLERRIDQLRRQA